MVRMKSALFIALCLAGAAPAAFAEAPPDGAQARNDAQEVQRLKERVEHHMSQGAASKLRRDVDVHRENMERARERNELAEGEEGSDEDLDDEGADSLE